MRNTHSHVVRVLRVVWVPPLVTSVPVSLYSIGGRARSVLFSLQQNGSFARFGIVGLRPRHAGGPDRPARFGAADGRPQL